MSEEDLPHLSAETFNALQEFYKEQSQKELELKLVSDQKAGDINVDEDWQLSQFWYNEQTINTLARIAIKSTSSKSKIALISCPTLYQKIKEKIGNNGQIHLYEFDDRFKIYGKDYIHYDYKMPLDIPRDKSKYYDIIIADPPFLSDECLTKTTVTIKYLAKEKIVLCTGAIMSELAERLLGLKKTAFLPKHKNNLANEFCCYSNFNLDIFLEK